MHIKKCNFKSSFFKLIQGMQHCMMLKSRGYDMTLSLLPSDFSRRNQRLIICFTSAGSKKELLAAAAQAPRDIAAGPFQPLGSPLPQKIQAGGIAVFLL